MNPAPLRRLLPLALALAAGTASAQSLDNLRISGFGQVIAGAMTQDGRSIPTQAYNSNDINFSRESLFGLQVSADLAENVQAVAQITARGATDYEAEFTWAYLNYQHGDHWNFKLGRQRVGLFAYSDFLDVGYAYPWIRPPQSVYNRFFTNFDGLSATYSRSFGDWRADLTYQGGAFDGDAIALGNQLAIKVDPYNSLALNVAYQDWLSFRAFYTKVEFTLNGAATTLGNDLRAAGQPGLARIVDIQDDPTWFGQVGFKIDRWNWIIEGEAVGQRVSNAINERRDDWYLSVAHRIGAFTPYVTYGQRRSQPDFALLASVDPSNPFYNRVRGLVLADETDADFQSAGLRWDVGPNVALKADWTHFDPQVAGRRKASLVSAGVAFTF